MPNAGYILSGEVTLEKKADRTKKHLIAGLAYRNGRQRSPRDHRRGTCRPLFYAETPRLPLSK